MQNVSYTLFHLFYLCKVTKVCFILSCFQGVSHTLFLPPSIASKPTAGLRGLAVTCVVQGPGSWSFPRSRYWASGSPVCCYQ